MKKSKKINKNDKKLQILKSFDMHVPHATKFYGNFENSNFDIFFAKKVVPN
jgi:hypothetical protein